MDHSVRIRLADARDLPDLQSLYSQLHPADSPLPPSDAATNLAKLAEIDGSGVYVLENEGAIAATCTLVVIPNLTRAGRPYALIENVVTDAAHRKRGHGAAVLKAAIQAAWDQNCYKVMLLTGSSDPATLRFYGNVGFQQSKTGFQIRRPGN